jgi:hypothetical protein
VTYAPLQLIGAEVRPGIGIEAIYALECGASLTIDRTGMFVGDSPCCSGGGHVLPEAVFAGLHDGGSRADEVMNPSFLRGVAL